MSVWFDCGQLGSDALARMIGVHDGVVYAAGYPSGHIYRHDGGTTWTDIGRLGVGTGCVAIYSFDGNLYAANTTGTTPSEYNLVFRYDGGTTWTSIGSLGGYYVEALIDYNGALYGCGYGVYRYDGGTTWTDINLPEGHHPEPLIVYNGEMYTIPTLTPTAKLYKYDGDSWTSVGVLTGTTWADAFAEFNDALYMGGGDTGLIFKWDGESLSQIDVIGAHVDGMVVYQGVLYACTWEDASLYASTDGQSFIKLGEFEEGMDAYELAVNDGKIFVCLSNGHVHFYKPHRPLWQPDGIGHMGRHFGIGV